MKDTTIFDLMVVYAHDIATAAYSADNSSSRPFPWEKENYNHAYIYFLKSCKKHNLKAAFTTSDHITLDGTFSAYWVIEKNKWVKIYKNARAKLIFDKLSPTTKEKQIMRKNLALNSKNLAFNTPNIFSLFFDKDKTYTSLTSSTVPTVAMSDSKSRSIDEKIIELKKMISHHPTHKDFSKKMILKDRFGAGGNRVFPISTNDPVAEIKLHMKANKNTSFILQPFVKFENGYKEFGKEGYVDTRIIYLEGKIMQAYTRTAKKHDFRCNEHQGGKLTYISKNLIPRKIRKASDKIVHELKTAHGLFALDFVISDRGTVYLLEGNCGPGLDWNLKSKENEKKAKLFIRCIIKTISNRQSTDSKTENILPQSLVKGIVPKTLPVAFKVA